MKNLDITKRQLETISSKIEVACCRLEEILDKRFVTLHTKNIRELKHIQLFIHLVASYGGQDRVADRLLDMMHKSFIILSSIEETLDALKELNPCDEVLKKARYACCDAWLVVYGISVDDEAEMWNKTLSKEEIS